MSGAASARNRMRGTTAPLAFSAFLSHRYKSPAVNRFFYRLFAEEAQVQFSVDLPDFPTNVTRLERLMREADAFVGVYPFPGEGLERPQRAELEANSRYFRLEMDLAERSRKPAIVFVDSRYGGVIDPPLSFIQCRYDWQQVSGDAPVPRASLFRERFLAFCAQVRASQASMLAHGQDPVRAHVGVLLPTTRDDAAGYTDEQIALIVQAVADTGATPLVMAWPPRLDLGLARTFETLDWAVVDVGDAAAATGIVAYLHGRFIPCLRLLRVDGAETPTVRLVEALYGAHQVGYRKDIVQWHDDASLIAGVQSRIANIMADRQRIADLAEAERYFARAAKRKERVFVSYTGRDAALAAPLIEQLKQRFQEVFDYKDGESIPAGTRWVESVFDRLATSPIGIPLLSPAYFESGNCVHEGTDMVALFDARKMAVFPIRLADMDVPSWIRQIQYIRHADHAEPKAIVDKIISQLPPG